MPAPYAYGESIVRLRRGPSPGRDPRGQPIPGPLVETVIDGCAVVPRSELPDAGGEQQQARDTVIIGLTVYAPPGADVLTTDKFIIRGAEYDVTGEPGDWLRSPFTGTPGPVQFAAHRASG